MDIGLDLGSILEEIDGVLELKVEIMIVGVWPKTDFLYNRFLSLCLYLLLLLLMLVLKLRIVDNLTNRWICFGRNLYQI